MAKKANKWALLIGINGYSNHGLAPLKHAEADAVVSLAGLIFIPIQMFLEDGLVELKARFNRLEEQLHLLETQGCDRSTGSASSKREGVE